MDIKKSIEDHLIKIEKKFNSNKIQGVDIINITQSKQLNLFIMKNLYDLWAINFKKNKIKYFNYDSTEVINATENMMNTLSNNISIEHNDFKILFEKAFQNLIQLAEKPKEFIKRDLIISKWHDAETLKKRSKYFKYYNELFIILINKMKENNEISLKSSELINYVDDITIDIDESLINEVCNLIDCTKEELVTSSERTYSDYSSFSLDKKEVDNLMLQACSKKSFEEAALFILEYLKTNHDNKLSIEDIRKLLYDLKENLSLSS